MNALFYEEQRFTQRWFWVMFIAVMFGLVIIFGYGMVEQLVFGKPWGDRPVDDAALIAMGSATILFCSFMIYVFYTLRLITEVRQDGLHIRFYPFRRRVIDYHAIQSCKARDYKPLREYGGWGIKYGPGGRAYNIYGNRGVQLVLTDGKRILIRSQRADELESAIRQFSNCLA